MIAGPMIGEDVIAGGEWDLPVGREAVVMAVAYAVVAASRHSIPGAVTHPLTAASAHALDAYSTEVA